MNKMSKFLFSEAVRSSLAEEVLVEDLEQGPKPLEPEVMPLPVPVSGINDGDPDSDGNQPHSK